jgi:hypothetical protein
MQTQEHRKPTTPKKGSIQPKQNFDALRRWSDIKENKQSKWGIPISSRRKPTGSKKQNTHTHNKQAKQTNNNPTKKNFKEKQIFKERSFDFFSPEFVFLVMSTIETDLATIGKTPSWGRQQEPQSGGAWIPKGTRGRRSGYRWERIVLPSPPVLYND